MTAKYAWREGGPTPKVSAQVFGKEVEKIAAGNDPLSIKPVTIVEAAGQRGSPIRTLFDWNDKKAGQRWRIQQARHYLGALQIVRVEVRGGPNISGKAYFSVSEKTRSYVPQSRVLSESDLRRDVISGAKRELESFVTKYQSILAFGNFISELQTVIDSMRDEIDRLELEATRRVSNTEAMGVVPTPAEPARKTKRKTKAKVG